MLHGVVPCSWSQPCRELDDIVAKMGASESSGAAEVAPEVVTASESSEMNSSTRPETRVKWRAKHQPCTQSHSMHARALNRIALMLMRSIA